MVYGKQNTQEQKNLYVYFEVNCKNIFNRRFCIVIVNAPKNNQYFDKMARKYCQNMSFTYQFTARKLFLKLVFAISRTNCFSEIIRALLRKS